MVAKTSSTIRLFSVTTLSLMLMMMTDAQAATRRNCNNSLVAVEVTPLDFGNFVGSIAGTVTVSTAGARSTTGPILVGGGSVSPGVFSLYTTISGCETYPVRVRGFNGTLSGTGPNMTVNNFDSDPVSEAFYLSPNANDPITVTVGADVSSATNQAAGVYTGTYRVRFRLTNP